jgi:hypothetical protein
MIFLYKNSVVELELQGSSSICGAGVKAIKQCGSGAKPDAQPAKTFFLK